MNLFYGPMQWTYRIFVLLGPLVASAFGQDQHPVTNRKYAWVMSADGAGWLERSEREREEEPEKALNALQLKPGMFVADVGAGTGYFARRIAKRVGPQGKVYATDIQPRMIELLKRNIARENLSNVEPVLSGEKDSGLPARQLDLILLVDVYHEFSRPQEMLRSMKEALKPSGRLVLLEYRKEDPDVPIRFEHKMAVPEAKAELEAEGLKLTKVIDTLPRQHILIFELDRK